MSSPPIRLLRTTTYPCRDCETQRAGCGSAERGKGDHTAVLGEPVLDARAACLIVERAMRAAVFLDRGEQVVVAFRVERLVGLLRVEAGAGEVAVDERGR